MTGILILIFWLACGLATWSASVAEWDRDFPMFSPSREGMVFGFLFGALGPFGLVPVAFLTSGFKHGFKLWPSKETSR